MIPFDEASERAVRVAGDLVSQGRAPRVVVVRDLFGRLRLILDGEKPPSSRLLKQIRSGFHGTVGAWSHPRHTCVLFHRDLVDFEALWGDADARPTSRAEVRFLDRMAVGRDWLRAPAVLPETTKPRAVLYGVRGGVGRTTAAALWALHLAREAARPRHVLVVDLDLEAPGLGVTLAGDDLPEMGVVDWLVEDIVGQGDAVLERMAVDVFQDALDGRLTVVPAVGLQAGHYPQKLARCVVDVTPPGRQSPQDPATRMARLIHDLERRLDPDVVLIDARSGLHDLAAIALNRLAPRLALLFAVNSSQTWSAYRLLFEHWQRWEPREPGEFARLLDSIKMVAAMIPETGADAYLARFRQSAWELFSDTLYPEEPPPGNLEEPAAPSEDPGPHHEPLPVYWDRRWQEFSPGAALDDWVHVEADYGEFLRSATELLLGELTPAGVEG